MTSEATDAVQIEQIATRIYRIRDENVMLDSDLALLYEVATGRLNEQVARNPERFPEDFAFRLTQEEFKTLMSQIAISKMGRGGRRKPPRVFTEQGVAILSSVLRSRRAAEVNVAIMRACSAGATQVSHKAQDRLQKPCGQVR